MQFYTPLGSEFVPMYQRFGSGASTFLTIGSVLVCKQKKNRAILLLVPDFQAMIQNIEHFTYYITKKAFLKNHPWLPVH